MIRITARAVDRKVDDCCRKRSHSGSMIRSPVPNSAPNADCDAAEQRHGQQHDRIG